MPVSTHTLRIASWNVNSLRVRLDQLLPWFEAAAIDVVGLQETKLTDDAFPTEAFSSIGLHTVISGQKTYNGVALIGRKPFTDVRTELPSLEDPQKRVIAASCDGVRYINVYVPNGQAVGADKYEYKLRWLRAFNAFLKQELATHPQVVVMGDFNIAPDDRDVHDPVAWRGQILCSDAEREALQALLALGLIDSFRKFEQPANLFSWWDYRQGGFRRNQGLRIDLLLVSAPMAERCTGSFIDTEPRRAERPSDHAPAIAEFQSA